MRPSRSALLTPALLLAAATACGNSSGTPDPGPSVELTASIGAVARDEADAALNALTLPTLLAPIGAPAGPPCAAPSPATDSDGDGIPDDAT